MDKKIIAIIVVVALVSVFLIGSFAYAYVNDEDDEFTFPDDWLNLFRIDDDDGDGDDDDDDDDDDGNDGDSDDGPTDIDIFVDPATINMGGWVIGQLTSSGGDGEYDITTKVVHTGSGQALSVHGHVEGGRYSLPKQINIPGYWQFQTTAENGVKSNTATLTVRGIQVNLEKYTYDKSEMDSLTINAFTHYADEDLLFVAHFPAGPWDVILGTETSNSGGYASIDFDFDGENNGDYEIDVIVGGGSDSADAWGGTEWVHVQD